MTSTGVYRLHGLLLSPYSLKLRAVLRYRRLPHVWVQGGASMELARQMKAPVIPVLELPDGKLINDTTLVIDILEEREPSLRSVVPLDAADAFLAFLIEDFADEWLTKAMFAYRWARPRDQAVCSRWIAYDASREKGRERLEGFARDYRQRQTGRMDLVGCEPDNLPLIETSTNDLLDILERHCVNQFALFGGGVSRAEFALFGQLSQIASDPTSRDLMCAAYPYTQRWVAELDDLSGHDPAEEPSARSLAVSDILALIGSIYLPFLSANAEALEEGRPRMTMNARGLPFSQRPFAYQVKCLETLKLRFAALSRFDRARIEPLLAETGCLNWLVARSRQPGAAATADREVSASAIAQSSAGPSVR